MLLTDLDHLESETELQRALQTNDKMMLCCGRMGPMCVPVYAAMEKLRKDYAHVAFFDQDFDGPASGPIRNLPECAGFMGLPFTVYFKNGEVVKATSSIQNEAQIREILDHEFAT